MTKTVEGLRNDIRYAIRLCERTARFYRHIQTFLTFATILGGSAALSALSSVFPNWVAISGAICMTIFGATSIAIRAPDKATANESDDKKYTALLAKSHGIDAVELSRLLDEARQTDAPEIEALRDVAYNDIVHEIGRPDAAVRFSLSQRIFAALA